MDKTSKHIPITQWAIDDRPREKAMLKGLESLSDAELAPVGKVLRSKPGQIATAAGLTYGLNAALGGDNRVLGGAYGEDDINMVTALASSNSGYDLSQLPG